jgi:hypothetical protein
VGKSRVKGAEDQKVFWSWVRNSNDASHPLRSPIETGRPPSAYTESLKRASSLCALSLKLLTKQMSKVVHGERCLSTFGDVSYGRL